jgi:hypothetical protein
MIAGSRQHRVDATLTANSALFRTESSNRNVLMGWDAGGCRPRRYN